MLKSRYRLLLELDLPAPSKGRQHYMHSFDLAHPTVPEGCEDYLPAVLALLEAAGARKGRAHITIDEKVVKAGESQRRPRPHVDGRYEEPATPMIIGYWGHGGGSSGWRHNCNQLGRPAGALQRMPVIVAASAAGCRVWEGDFDGTPKDDGDLSHITDQLGEGIVVPARMGALLSPDCVHESVIMTEDTPRTFLRIALPPTFAV